MDVKVAIGISKGEVGGYAAFDDFLSKVGSPPNTIELHARGANIAENRNVLGERALEQGCTHVWYVDQDQLFHPATLMSLLARDVDIVSGLYMHRARPFPPQVFDREDPDGRCWRMELTPEHSGLLPVIATGAGCFLVRTSVLEAMERPWWRLGQIGPAAWGDDLNFCHRAREAGFTVHVDLDVPVGHIALMGVWPARTEQGWGAMLVPADGYESK